jgi:hypothetical protein
VRPGSFSSANEVGGVHFAAGREIDRAVIERLGSLPMIADQIFFL